MTVDIATENEIRRLHDVERWKRGTIVAELDVHSDVVARVLDPGRERALVFAPRSSLVDPFESFIDETLKAHPRLRATRLYDMIRMRGYDGGIAILRRHVAAVRPIPRGEVYLRVERLIGEQAQVADESRRCAIGCSRRSRASMRSTCDGSTWAATSAS